MRVSLLILILLIFFIAIVSLYYFIFSEIDDVISPDEYDNNPPALPDE